MVETRILVISSETDEIRSVLEPRFPSCRIAYAASPEEVMPALDDLKPEVVFSVKTAAFATPEHKQALEYPTVRWFHVGGSGYDHVAPWSRSDLTVTNSAGVLAPFLAETVIGAMFLLNAGFHIYRDRQKAREWRQIPFRGLAGRHLLVVGMGAIGAEVAARAKALGLRVTGFKRTGGSHPAADAIRPLDEVGEHLPHADFVSLHLRLTEDTRHMFGRELLGRMRPDSFLINTARGDVVDEQALVEALRSGCPKAAYLDVFAVEPLPRDSELWQMENVFLTPHASDCVSDWRERFAVFFADNLERWQSGDRLENVVSG